MKKCPTCEKTFEDSYRFCQLDGTPLVDATPPLDPYATIVASPAEFSREKAEPPTPSFEPPVQEPAAPSFGSPVHEPAPPAVNEPAEPIQPESDPLKTMFVSEAEMQEALGANALASELAPADIPYAATPPAEPAPTPESSIPTPEPTLSPEPTPTPEPPKFNEPDLPAPSFGDVSPPPSPFAEFESVKSELAAELEPIADEPAVPIQPDFSMTSPPIPSPFDAPKPAPREPVAEPPKYNEPFTAPSPFDPPKSSSVDSRPFEEPKTVIQPAVSTPFEQPQSPAAWTPPPAPAASWQNQEIGSNTPFQSPSAGTGSQNLILPIVSLVLGILSICCPLAILTGPAALITGFLGMKNIKNDPNAYGGKGLAIAGMAIGGLFFLIGAAYWILRILVIFGILGGSILRGY